MSRLLLLSNSTNYNEAFLAWPETYLRSFLTGINAPLLFIPNAAITLHWDQYANMVNARFAAMGHQMVSLHNEPDPRAAVDRAPCIVVGGGNSFHLLHHVQRMGVLELLKEKVKNGIPYIGWSAGSNLACPTIKTTNDMPVIETGGLIALHLVPFQINPHFTEKSIKSHGGESRTARIEEFIRLNQDTDVVGMPEGTLIEVREENLYFRGSGIASVFRFGRQVRKLEAGMQADWLL